MAPEPAGIPRLADGVELLGEFRDSGCIEPPSLVRRGDGQVIQMSRLLYRVACGIDGSRDVAAIAGLVSAGLGRSLTAEQVRYLITTKLVPLGVVADPNAPATPPRANPLLTLRARGTLLPERAASAAGTLLRPLFRWPVVVTVIATVAAMDYWMLSAHGLGAGLRQVLRDPADMLIVAALLLASAVFHECGHAAGCRYGGARPGRIGVGIYLVWPSFFTNVTDSYRLSRGGRLRTDLGGVYFNLIFILAVAGIYQATSAEILLLVVAFSHLEILEQLLPFARFDGYYILSDLIGVPDLFTRVTGLRQRTRMLITSWLACTMLLLTATFGYLLLRFPAINRALWAATVRQARRTAIDVAGQHYAAVALDVLSVLLTVLSITGSIYVVGGLARRAIAAALRWSADRPARRLLAVAASVAGALCLAACWALQGEFRGW
jgi:putative peptide zinc metalloprotease protein